MHFDYLFFFPWLTTIHKLITVRSEALLTSRYWEIEIRWQSFNVMSLFQLEGRSLYRDWHNLERNFQTESQNLIMIRQWLDPQTCHILLMTETHFELANIKQNVLTIATSFGHLYETVTNMNWNSFVLIKKMLNYLNQCNTKHKPEINS